MNNPRIWRGVLITVLCAGFALAIGAGAFQMGLAHGLAESGQALIGQPGTSSHLQAWPYWGHGFFFGPFFFVFLLMLLSRVLFWRRPWRGGCYHRHDGVPPAFEEWHRRVHEQQGPTQSPGGAPTPR